MYRTCSVNSFTYDAMHIHMRCYCSCSTLFRPCGWFDSISSSQSACESKMVLELRSHCLRPGSTTVGRDPLPVFKQCACFCHMPRRIIAWPLTLSRHFFSFFFFFFSSFHFFGVLFRYLDRNFTVAQGRRVSKEKALPQCNVREIFTVLESKKCALTCGFEPYKSHPKNPAGHKDGRVRVMLFDADKKPCNPAIPNKQALLNYLCERIPHTELRKDYEKKVAEMKEKRAADAAIKAKEDAKAKQVAAAKKKKKKK